MFNQQVHQLLTTTQMRARAAQVKKDDGAIEIPITIGAVDGGPLQNKLCFG
jgi:hypothetical protein